ncbi:MAG: Mur ligase domain-containing protein [Georgfuchsia sp.]
MNAITIIELLQRQGVSTDWLCLDSRRVQRGDIFVACRGASRDGRDFIKDAVHRGAAAVLHDAEPGRAIESGVPRVAVNDLAGKGHVSYQEIAGVKHPFSDMGSAQRALEHCP